MSGEKTINEQLDELNKLILDLDNIEVQIDGEDQVLLLVCSFPKMLIIKDTFMEERIPLSLSLEND